MAFLAQVWFSGSTFLVGSASTHDGFELAAREKVALTLLQHRLSMRSFLRWAGPRARTFDNASMGRGLALNGEMRS